MSQPRLALPIVRLSSPVEVDVCGRPGKCKQNLTSVRACGRVLTCVRPRKATSTRRGPLWNTWIRSNSARRAFGTHQPNDSSDPASDRLPIILVTTSPHFRRLATSGSAICGAKGRSLVDAAASHQSPGDPRQFVRQSNRDKLRRLLRKHSGQP